MESITLAIAQIDSILVSGAVEVNQSSFLAINYKNADYDRFRLPVLVDLA